MNPIWAAAGAIVGLAAGAGLRAPVFRLSVASGEPGRSACVRCSTPTPRGLAIRCGHCGASFGSPLVLELTTACVLALVLGRFADKPDVVAFGFFSVLGVALAAIDVAVQRLPDPLTLPAYPILIGLLAAAAIVGHDVAGLVRALLGGLALAAAYLLLALIRPGQLGGGDVKLAGLAGMTMGWLGWPTLVAGTALAFVLSALVAVALLAARRVTLHSAICFGPFLFGGALLAMLTSGR